MRHPSSFSFHRAAAAAAISAHTPATSTASSMPTRPPFRGGGRSFRGGERSYSNRPQNISGDSHFQSVRDVNTSFQRNSTTTTTNNHNNNYNALRHNYDAPHNYKNYSYGNNHNHIANNYVSRTGGRGGGEFRPRGSQQYNFRPNQPPPRAQRQKPADYRTWENAEHPPPANAERFTVLSYNILADYLANGHRKLYFHIPRRFMDWVWRKNNILFELKLWSPDIMCFQEVDRFQEFEEDLRILGYSGIWKMRTGEPVDGCAIFWRTTRFKLMYEECVEFNKHGMRDNVAQVCVLESLRHNQSGDQSPLSSSGSPKRLVVCNIHVLYNPRRGEIKLGQVRILLERAKAVSKTWDDAPIVLCGDFNCTPKSPLYNFISDQKLDVSQVERDKVSGQASAEIHPPSRTWGHRFSNTETVDRRGSNNPNYFQSDNTLADSESVALSMQGHTTDLASQSVLGKAEGSFPLTSDAVDMNASSASNCDKVTISSLSEINEPIQDDENLDENAEEFLAALHDGEDAFSSNLAGVSLVADKAAFFRVPYNPSLWTAMEIATATGDTGNTVLEHSLKLRSTYLEVMGSSGTRDSFGEPLVTSYNSCFMGTVDYIWSSVFVASVTYRRSEGLQTCKVLAPIPKDVMQPSRGFPTKKWGSDHVALASELAFIDTGEC